MPDHILRETQSVCANEFLLNPGSIADQKKASSTSVRESNPQIMLLEYQSNCRMHIFWPSSCVSGRLINFLEVPNPHGSGRISFCFRTKAKSRLRGSSVLLRTHAVHKREDSANTKNKVKFRRQEYSLERPAVPQHCVRVRVSLTAEFEGSLQGEQFVTHTILIAECACICENGIWHCTNFEESGNGTKSTITVINQDLLESVSKTRTCCQHRHQKIRTAVLYCMDDQQISDLLHLKIMPESLIMPEQYPKLPACPNHNCTE